MRKKEYIEFRMETPAIHSNRKKTTCSVRDLDDDFNYIPNTYSRITIEEFKKYWNDRSKSFSYYQSIKSGFYSVTFEN